MNKLISSVIPLTLLVYLCFSSFCLAKANSITNNAYTKHLFSFKNSHNISSLAWHPNEQFLATGGLSKTISIWDIKHGKLIKTIDREVGGVGALAYSPNGKYLAVGRTFTRHIPEKYNINIYDVETGKLLKSFIPPPAPIGQSNDIKTLSFSMDGRLLAANGYGSRTNGVVYDFESGEVLTILTNTTSNKNSGYINSLSFSPDGKYLAIGRSLGTIDIWSIDNWDITTSFSANENGVYSLAYSPDGEFLVAASNKKSINIWNIREKALSKSIDSKHTGYIRIVQFSPDGKILASGGSDKSVTLFNSQEPSDNKRLEGFRNVAYPYISPQGTYMAIVYGQNVELQTSELNSSP
jgi:WD40 repeat protein